MQNANRLFSAFLASLFLVSLVPTPAGAGFLNDNTQVPAIEAQFGDNAPFGTVGKMLEEVTLFMHSESLAAAGTDYPQRIVNSFTAAADPAAPTNPVNTGYSQLQVPVANFEKSDAILTSVYAVAADPAPGAAVPRAIQPVADEPNDPNNKRVRIGYLDPAGYAPSAGTVPSPDLDPAPDVFTKGFDVWESVSFLTPPSLAAESDFRVYDLKVDAWAQCGFQNQLDTFNDANWGDLIVNVYRTDASGARLATVGTNDAPVLSVNASKTKTGINQNGLVSGVATPGAGGPGRHVGSWLETRPDLNALQNNVRPVPSFFLDQGLLVRQGERLEFEFGLSVSTSFWVNNDAGVLSDANEGPDEVQPLTPYDAECFLHFDTAFDDTLPTSCGSPACTTAANAPLVKYFANDPTKPNQVVQYPGRGYEARLTLIGDTLRASTWFSDANGKLAAGLGDGDTFNVDTVFASAWGGLASAAAREDQPKELDTRVKAKFRNVQTLEEVSFGAPIAGPFVFPISNSVLGTRTSYGFAPGTKPLVAYTTELYIRDPTTVGTSPATQPLRLRDQIFENATFAVSPPVFVGKTGMDFALGDGEVPTHLVNPGEATIFTYKVSNLGSSLDTITISADAVGGGWTVQVLNSQQVVGGGGSASVNVLVTPPATAGAGSISPPIRVRAISSFADIIQPKQAQDVFVSVVSEVIRDVNITSATTTIALKPGETRLFGVSVRNAGTATENVLVVPSVPGDVQGWTLKALPVAKQVLAGARADFQIEVRAPNDAVANLQFPLTVTSSVVGAGAAQDALSVATRVVGRNLLSVEFSPADRVVDVREWGNAKSEGPIVTRVDARQLTGQAAAGEPRDACVGAPNDSNVPSQVTPQQRCIVTDQDPTFTDTIFVPFDITNKGTLTDTYTIKRTHSPFGDWSYRFFEYGNVTPGAFVTTATAPHFPLTIAPGMTKTVILEVQPAAGGRRSTAIDTDGTALGDLDLALSVASANDATLASPTVSVKLITVAPGTQLAKGQFAGSTRDVDIRIAPGNVTETSTRQTVTSRYYFYAQNLGNERDNLTVRVNQPPSGSGWTQGLSFVGPMVTNDTGQCTRISAFELRCGGPVLTGAANTPAARYGLRVGEQVLLALDVTPGAFVPLGTTFRSTVSVSSGIDGAKEDILELATFATGSFVFDVVSRAPTLTVEKGGQANIPFAIRNLGTSGDDYSVSLVSGNADFKPRLSVPDKNFVPGGSVLHGFLTVTAPANATTGHVVPFRIQVSSNGTPLVGHVDLTATVVNPSNLRVVGIPATVLVEQRGVDQKFQVKVTDVAARNGTATNVSLDASRLPAGWTIFNRTGNATNGTNNGFQVINLTTQPDGTVSGIANFTVRAPAADLGVSRVPMRFTAINGTESGFADIVFDLTSIAALSISAPDGATGIATAGSEFVYQLRVKNNGTGNDLVTMSATGVPAGWNVSFNPTQTTLGPLEEQRVDMTVKAPQGATPRTIAPIVAFATGSSGAVAQRLITTTIGYLELSLNRTSDATILAGPQEAASYVLNVTNTGTLTADIGLNLSAVAAQYASHVTLSALPALLEDVRPGESRDVLVRAVLGDAPPAGARIPVTAAAKFVSAAAPEASLANMTVEVLDYVSADVDGDGIQEYALDRDHVANGYESFIESTSTSGKQSSSLVMTRYLSNASLQRYLVEVPTEDGNVTQEVRYMLDGDKDGRVDHFIDSDGNLLPDRYWDPDSGVLSVINTTKDINGDDIPELFVDLTGDQRFDAVYDLDKGNWTTLRILDLDGDLVEDYYVDADNDNRLDADETVLYARTGQLLSVQKIDLNGDGTPDSVFDTDGDGRADSFIVAGSTESIPIVYRDVNNDKVLDWTYDLDGDGKEESYYDPATGEVHLIDNEAGFYAALKDHWYIGALFGLVALLFLVLLAVTRR